MPTTRANAPPPQAFAQTSVALHPYMDGQTESRAFPTATPIPKLPSSDVTSPGKHSLDIPPSEVPKKLEPKELREFSGDEKQESYAYRYVPYQENQVSAWLGNLR